MIRRLKRLATPGMILSAIAQDEGAARYGAARHRILLTEGDVQLDVIREGSGPGVVLVPSSLRDSEDYDEVAGRIAACGFTVLRPQPRGMGASSPPPPGMTLSTLAGDVVRVVDRLGGGRAVLVGHAYGHFVVRVADLEHPRAIRGIVALAAAARSFPPGMPQALAIASDPTQDEAARLAALRTAFFAAGNDPRPWLEGWHPSLRAAYREAGTRPPKDAWWPVAQAPILDLQAAEDPWRPASTREELRDVLGNRITVRVIPGASHALVPEQPAAVAEAIVDWIRTLPQA